MGSNSHDLLRITRGTHNIEAFALLQKKVNGKIYISETADFNQRFSQRPHRSSSYFHCNNLTHLICYLR